METDDGFVEDDPLIFPNALRRARTSSRSRSPVDDTHTKKFVIPSSTKHGAPRAVEPRSQWITDAFPQEQGKSAAGVAYPERPTR